MERGYEYLSKVLAWIGLLDCTANFINFSWRSDHALHKVQSFPVFGRNNKQISTNKSIFDKCTLVQNCRKCPESQNF